LVPLRLTTGAAGPGSRNLTSAIFPDPEKKRRTGGWICDKKIEKGTGPNPPWIDSRQVRIATAYVEASKPPGGRAYGREGD